MLFGVVQGILLVPLYLREMSVGLYGAWLATGNVLSWIELVDPGLAIALQQRVGFLLGRRDVTQLRRAAGTGLALAAVMALVPLLAWPAAGAVAAFVRLSGNEANGLAAAFRLGLIALAVSMVANAIAAINVGLQRPGKAGLSALAAGLVGIVATLVALFKGAGVVSIPLGGLARAATLLALNGAALIRWQGRYLKQGLEFDRSELRQLTATSGVLFSTRFGVALLGRVDALLTARLISPEATTVYVLTTKAAEVAKGLAERPSMGVMPALSHLCGEGERARAADIVDKVLCYVGWLSAAGMALLVATNRTFVTAWVGEGMFGGETLTLLSAVALGAAIYNSTCGNLLMAMGELRQVAWLGLAEAAVKIPVQLCLFGTLGILAMPVGSLAGTILVGGWFLAATLAKQFQRPRWEKQKRWILSLLELTLACGLAFVLLRWQSPSRHAGDAGRLALLVGSSLMGAGSLLVILDPRARELLVSLYSRLSRRRGSSQESGR